MSSSIGDIRFQCSRCGTDLTVSAAQANAMIACSSCQEIIRVPAPAPSTEPFSAPEPVDIPRTVPLEVETIPAATRPIIEVAESTPPMEPVSVQPAPVNDFQVRTSANGSAQSAPAPIPYTSRESAAPKPSGAKKAIIAVTILVLLGAGGAVAMSISNGKERVRIENEVETLVAGAEQSFQSRDFDKAVKAAADARDKWKQSPQTLTESKVKHWGDRVQRLEDLKKQSDQLNAALATAQEKFQKDPETDLSAAANKIQNLKDLLKPVSDDNRVVDAQADRLLDEVAILQAKQRLVRLQKRLEAANDLYKSGKIEEAAAQAELIRQSMDENPKFVDNDLSNRLEILKKRGERLAEARKIRISTSGVPGIQALSRYQNLLVSEKDDVKPLASKIEILQKELVQEAHQEIESLYRAGRIEQSGEKATALTAEIASTDLGDNKLRERLAAVSAAAASLAEVRALVKNAKESGIAKAKAEIIKKVEQLGALEENKPVVARLEAMQAELAQKEKRSKQLSQNDANELTNIANELNRRDKKIAPGSVEGDTIQLKYDGKPLAMGLSKTLLSKELFLQAGDNRFTIDISAMERRAGRVMQHAIALGTAMEKAGVWAEDMWDASEEAPFVSARRIDKDTAQVFLNDRLYVGKMVEKTEERKAIEAAFGKAAEDLAVAIEKDETVPQEVKAIVTFTVRKTATEADWHDHQPGEFIRKVLKEGYVEKNIPGAADRMKKELAAFNEAYKQISQPVETFSGKTATSDEAVELQTFEGHAIWRLYDKAANQTSFAVKNPDDERSCLFILYDFPGKLDAFPNGKDPLRVRMTHQAVGVTATYDFAAGKMEFDPATWDRSVILENPNMPQQYRDQKGYGEPSWPLPPHVLLVDLEGDSKSLVTPYGKLDIQDFSQIADRAEREKKMELFLDKMSVVLPTANYLHLYFRYFFEYILDSPITSSTSLLGSRAHCGDIHQTAYQSLERFMGGRYVGDCDDLAEFFQNIVKRRNKLAFVMALPQHAACGWVEKEEGDKGYTAYVIDTGPPRIFKDKDLDKVMEKAYRAYDDDQTMRFDPKSLGYLFRFNGEPTRTPYYLSTRMYVDKEYAAAMEKVQSYWHFHFYALGVQTMKTMIEGGDKVPENWIELAGLFGQVKETEDSNRCTMEAIKQFGPDDQLSRMSEEFRMAMMWRGEHDNAKAYEIIKNSVTELKALEKNPRSITFFGMRLQIMGLLNSIDRPFEAWSLVQKDIMAFARAKPPRLKIDHVAGLTSVYKKMKDFVREGEAGTRPPPSAAEAADLKRLDELLTWFYTNQLFEPEDDFNDWMRKYAFVGVLYAGRYGQKKMVEELLKDGPFPDPSKPREHGDRSNPEEEDWKWIRLSLASYSMAIEDALDFDEPQEKWRKDEAVKLSEKMFQAAEHARKFGSLASSEFSLLSTRVFRDFMVKDWADLEKVLQEVHTRDWARLTTDVAETIGRGARFVTPEEFAQQYRLFAKYVKARPAYFTVVYEAYRADAIDQALAASKVALENWPNDEDMKREAGFLEDLAKKKKERNAKKEKDKKEPGAKVTPPAPEPPIKQ